MMPNWSPSENHPTAGILGDIANELSSIRDWEDTVGKVIELLCAAFPSSRLAIALDLDGWRTFSCHEAAVPGGADLGNAIRESFDMLSGNREPGPLAYACADGKSFLNIPIVGADRMAGILHICSDRAEAYSVDDVSFVSIAASMIGSFLRNVRAYVTDVKAIREVQEKRLETQRSLAEKALAASERKYRELVEGVNSIILRWNREGEVTFINRYGLEFFGYAEDDLLGRNVVGTITPPTDSAGRDLRAMMRDIMIHPARYRNNENENMLKSGERVWIAWRNTPVCDDRGNVTEVLSVGIDVTARKRVEQELLTERERLRLAQEAAKIGAFEWDPRTDNIVATGELRALYGLSPDEPLDTMADWARRVVPEDLEPARRDMERAITQGSGLGDFRIVWPDGALHWLQTRARAFYDNEGRPIRVVGVNVDITDIKRAEAEIVRLNAELEQRVIERTSELEEQIVETSRAEETALQNETLVRHVLEVLPVGVWITDRNGVITTGNPAGRRIWGGARYVGPKEYDLYKGWRVETGERIEAGDWAAVKAVREGKTTLNELLEIEAFTGEHRFMLNSSIPIRDENGEIRGAVVVNQDVTDLMKVRNAVAKAREEAEHQVHVLQQALIPTQPTIESGYDIASIYIPAVAGQEIGGDFYDVFRTETGQIGILIGDVSGKGVEAAALAATARSTVRAFAFDISSPGAAVTHANSVLVEHPLGSASFVTVFLAVLDPITGEIRYSGAGHPPPAIRRRDGEVEFLSFGHPPVGLAAGYEFSESPAVLNPGDKIVFYTDGISEARHDATLFGLEGIGRTLANHGCEPPKQLLASLLSDATDWANGILRDDIAIIVIERE